MCVADTQRTEYWNVEQLFINCKVFPSIINQIIKHESPYHFPMQPFIYI